MKYFAIFAILLILIGFLFVASCSSDPDITDDENQLTFSEEVLNKFSNTEVRLFLSTPYKEDREPEFSDYVKMLTDKRVDQPLINQLIQLVQNDNADRFFVANMIYLMGKAGFPDAMEIIKEHLFDPDIYTQIRCIKAFQYVADTSDKSILLNIISSNVESEEVISTGKKVYLTLVTKNDFDELFNKLVNADDKLNQDLVQKEFIIQALNYCLDKKHTKEERKIKDLKSLKKLPETSQLAQEFIVSRLKGRLTHPNISTLVDIYTNDDNSRSLHLLVYEEILRLFVSDGDKISISSLNKNFEQTLIKDLITSDQTSDIKPKGIVTILGMVGLNNTSQEQIEDYLMTFELSDVNSYTIIQTYKLLMETGKLSLNVENILTSAINNRQLRDYSVAGLQRMVDNENVENQQSIVQLIFDFIEIATKQQDIHQLARLLSKLGTNDAIELLIQGLNSKSKIVAAACSEAVIALNDKSYFTLKIRQDKLIENILRNINSNKHNIIAALKVLGEIGTKGWDKQLMQQYCRLQDDSDVAQALGNAVEKIDSRDN